MLTRQSILNVEKILITANIFGYLHFSIQTTMFHLFFRLLGDKNKSWAQMQSKKQFNERNRDGYLFFSYKNIFHLTFLTTSEHYFINIRKCFQICLMTITYLAMLLEFLKVFDPNRSNYK